jgi:hypothetical protein
MTASAARRGPIAHPGELRRVEHAVARILAERERAVEVHKALQLARGMAR